MTAVTLTRGRIYSNNVAFCQQSSRGGVSISSETINVDGLNQGLWIEYITSWRRKAVSHPCDPLYWSLQNHLLAAGCVNGAERLMAIMRTWVGRFNTRRTRTASGLLTRVDRFVGARPCSQVVSRCYRVSDRTAVYGISVRLSVWCCVCVGVVLFTASSAVRINLHPIGLPSVSAADRHRSEYHLYYYNVHNSTSVKSVFQVHVYDEKTLQWAFVCSSGRLALLPQYKIKTTFVRSSTARHNVLSSKSHKL